MLRLSCFLGAILVPLTLAACTSSPDDLAGDASGLEGLWRTTEYNDNNVIEFGSDGTLLHVQSEFFRRAYELTPDSLFVAPPRELTFTEGRSAHAYSLGGDTLEIQWPYGWETYVRLAGEDEEAFETLRPSLMEALYQEDLYAAIQDGDLDAVRQAFADGASPNLIPNDELRLPLFEAANRALSEDGTDESLAIVQELLDQGADPNLSPSKMDDESLLYEVVHPLPSFLGPLPLSAARSDSHRAMLERYHDQADRYLATVEALHEHGARFLPTDRVEPLRTNLQRKRENMEQHSDTYPNYDFSHIDYMLGVLGEGPVDA